MNTAIRPRRRTIRRILFIILGLGACAGILYAGFILVVSWTFNWMDDMFDSPMCEPTNRSGIESVTGFSFPPSAEIITSHCEGLANWSAEVQFDIDPSEVDAFVSSTDVKLPLSMNVAPSTLGCCDQLADKVKSHLYGFYSSGELFEDIFIDTSNPAKYRVYFTLLVG